MQGDTLRYVLAAAAVDPTIMLNDLLTTAHPRLSATKRRAERRRQLACVAHITRVLREREPEVTAMLAKMEAW